MMDIDAVISMTVWVDNHCHFKGGSTLLRTFQYVLTISLFYLQKAESDLFPSSGCLPFHCIRQSVIESLNIYSLYYTILCA